MSSPQEFFTEGKEDASLPFGARVLYPNASWNMVPITQSVVSAISYKSFQLPEEIQTSTGNFTVADVVYDTYQTGDAWNSGGPGFNFAATFPAACFPRDGRYRIELELTLTNGSVVDLWINHRAAKRLSS